MGYIFQESFLYRMPTHFGPSLGPRQGPGKMRFDNTTAPEWTRYCVQFRTQPAQLETLVPSCFSIKESIVTLQWEALTKIPWLAGRGYNIFGVSFPVTFHGKVDHVEGDFLAVAWENLADAIMTGREELGFAKLYCELPTPHVSEGSIRCTASWMGHQFFEMELDDLQEAPPVSASQSMGLLHYKYIPKTGAWGDADASYVTFSPFATMQPPLLLESWRGKGRMRFLSSTWEELPTLVSIVNTLASLDIVELIGASVLKGQGGSDLYGQRILR